MDSELTIRDDQDPDETPGTDSVTLPLSHQDLSRDKNLLALYELHYWKYPDVFPTPKRINAEYQTDFTDEELKALLTQDKVKQRFTLRGVPTSPKDFKSRLTPRQVEWIQFLIDPTSRKTVGGKCKEFGITWQQHSAWMRNPLFQETLKSETDKLAADRRFEVFQGLINEASSGNVQAAKIYLEWSGELKNEVNINVTHEHKILIHKIIDVLAVHIDADTLAKVADDLDGVLNPQSQITQGRQVIDLPL